MNLFDTKNFQETKSICENLGLSIKEYNTLDLFLVK